MYSLHYNILLGVCAQCCVVCLIVRLQVRVRRIQIFPLFEDYDRVHIGSVTRSQVYLYMLLYTLATTKLTLPTVPPGAE